MKPLALIGFLMAALSMNAGAQPSVAPAGQATLFRDVRVFDGKSDRLSPPTSVLVQGNRIMRIGADAAAAGAQVIEGGGRTLMPGLIDAHWHTMLIRLTPEQAIFGDVGYLNIAAAAEARATLMRGFTSVRDMGGPSFGLKQAIDRGVAEGPRIFPSGAMITVTSGHGDFRQLSDLPRSHGELSRMETIGGSAVADSPDEVRLRTREQLMQGASQIKLTAGGGVSSPFSPIDVVTFTEPEIHAAVVAAENWGTYVTVHAFTAAAIQQAIAAGVKCVEHGFLMDEATAKMMAEKGVWLSIQPLPDEMQTGFPEGSVQREKADQIFPAIGQAYQLAKKYRLKTAWGTDVLFSEALARRQGAILASLTQWYTSAETLAMATGTNAELLEMSGKRDPYYPGKIGVVQEGALADLLLVDGDPLQNINLVANPDRSFMIIMKDGKIYKNTLPK